MDQCIWPIRFDAEDIALKQCGVIPDPLKLEEDLSLGASSDQPNDYHLLVGRDITLAHYSSSVTPQISRLTNLPEGKIMGNDVLRGVGRYIGSQMINQGIIRPEAYEVIKTCMENDIRVVILTATPFDIAQGVMEAVEVELELPRSFHVLGRELSFDEVGRAKEELFTFGPAKREIVEESKRRGAIAYVGVGDKARKGDSDEFVFECKLQGVIDNNSSEKGDNGWRDLLLNLQQELKKE